MRYRIIRAEVVDEDLGHFYEEVMCYYPQIFKTLKEAVRKFKYLHSNRIGPGYNDIIRWKNKKQAKYITDETKVFSNIWIYNNIEM